MKKSGFSLVEITVVLAITVILTGLSASTFVSARNQYILDATLEETVNYIREAQIRSVSISKSEDEDLEIIPKGWGLEINDDTDSPTLSLLRVVADTELDGRGKVETEGEPYAPIAGTSIVFEEGLDGRYLFFMTPFGEPYITTENCDEKWEASSKLSEEYIPGGDCSIESSITLKISYKNKNAKIIIDKRGGIVVTYG